MEGVKYRRVQVEIRTFNLKINAASTDSPRKYYLNLLLGGCIYSSEAPYGL